MRQRQHTYYSLMRTMVARRFQRWYCPATVGAADVLSGRQLWPDPSLMSGDLQEVRQNLPIRTDQSTFLARLLIHVCLFGLTPPVIQCFILVTTSNQ